MVDLDLGDLGAVSIGKKLVSNLKISSDKLFERYPNLAKKLSPESITIIRSAVDGKKDEKTKKNESEIYGFFNGIRQIEGKYGFGADEVDEMERSEKLKQEQMDSGKVDYSKYETSTGEIETIDRTTGREEGKIVLGRAGDEGKLVPVKINENLTMFFEHDATTTEKKNETKGKFSVENVSAKDRLWDIDIALTDIDNTDLEDEKIEIKELSPSEVKEQEYNLKVDGKTDISVSEFISTLNDPKTESYSLVLNTENEIYCSIDLKNISSDELTELEIDKIIPKPFENIQIINKTVGTAEKSEYEGEQSVNWKIDKIGAGNSAKLEVKMEVKIDNKDTKVRSGKIIAKYISPHSISDVKIDKFDAFTNNHFYIGTYEKDEEPDKYECQFTFENKSEFLVRLVNADVYDKDDPSVKYVDIDPGEVPVLASEAKWISNIWDYESKDGKDPSFKTKCEFFAVADHQIQTEGIMNIQDIELAVASIEGVLLYDVEQLASFKETEFNIQMKVTNTGGADLNEVILTETIQAGFKPPTLDQILVSLNGDEIEISSESKSIEPSNLSTTGPHTVSVKLEDLRNQPLEAFHPGDTIEVNYPIIALKPAMSVKYISDVLYKANTYPAGKPIEVKPEMVEIEVMHIRRRSIKGKEITALANSGEYEISLYVVNTGQHEITNYEVLDKIPDNFEYSDMTLEPEITTVEGADVLRWNIDKIAPGERAEIKYKISGEGRPSDAQNFLATGKKGVKPKV